MSVEQQTFSVLLALIEMEVKDFCKSVQHLERLTHFEDASQWQCIQCVHSNLINTVNIL